MSSRVILWSNLSIEWTFRFLSVNCYYFLYNFDYNFDFEGAVCGHRSARMNYSFVADVFAFHYFHFISVIQLLSLFLFQIEGGPTPFPMRHGKLVDGNGKRWDFY